MTAKPIRQLLNANPFVKFTLHLGFENETTVSDPNRCRLDEEEAILYVSHPEVPPPSQFAKRIRGHPASVEIIDLRHVSIVTVEADAMPE